MTSWQGGATFALALVFAAAAPAAGQVGSGILGGYYTVAKAAAQDKLDDVQALLMQHRDPDAADDDGRTALFWAINYDNVAMARLLLDYGAHPDARDGFGNTVLHWAAQRGSVDFVTLLIAAKATVDAANRQGVTPLMQAAANGKLDVARLLLANGADPKKQDFTGRDAIGWAAGKPNMLQLLAARPPG